MTANFFSNRDPDLPSLNLKNLPKIKASLPRIQVKNDSNLLFDNEDMFIDEVAETFSNIYFNS